MTTISQERSKLAAVKGAPKLRRREQWGSTFSYTGRFTVAEPATRVFIHISVTNPGNYNSNDAHARALESIGRSRFPNTGVSYSRGCMPNAALYELQPIGRQGAHTVNDFRRSTCTTSGCPGRGKSLTAPSWNLNVNARAYVLCQNVGNTVSDAQVDALARAIVADYRAGFITREAAHNPHGHRCVSAKSCPGDRMWAKMSALHTKIHHYLDNGLPGGSTPPPKPPPTQEDDMPYRDWPKADRDALTADVARAVWTRDNPTLELSYGSVVRFVLNALRPDRGQATKQTVPWQVWNYSTDAQPDVRGKMLRQARNGVVALEEMLSAQRPLLEAAAAGQSLSTEEVQAIAEQVSRLRIELHMIDGDDGDDGDVPDSEPDDQ